MDELVNTTGQFTPEQAEQLCEQFVAEVESGVLEDLRFKRTDYGFMLGYPEPIVSGTDMNQRASQFMSRVALDGATRTYKVWDQNVAYEENAWDGSRSFSKFTGSGMGMVRRKTYGRLPDGSRGVISDRQQRWGDVHAPVRAAAEQLGWTEVRSSSTMGALWFGIGILVALAVSGIVVGILALTGNLT